MAVKPFRVCSDPLEAVEILESTSEEQISFLPPVKPKCIFTGTLILPKHFICVSYSYINAAWLSHK